MASPRGLAERRESVSELGSERDCAAVQDHREGGGQAGPRGQERMPHAPEGHGWERGLHLHHVDDTVRRLMSGEVLPTGKAKPDMVLSKEDAQRLKGALLTG